MNRALSTLAIVCLAVSTTACPGSTEPGGGRNATISNDEEALAAFLALKYAAEAIDDQIATNFTGPLSLSGASVSGSKTASSTSSSSSSSSTSTTDIYVSFSGYSSGGATISGTVRWYDYYYGRTACSSSYCASSSDDYESLDGTSINITFEYDGKKYSDVISVDGSRDDVSTWSISVTNKAGVSFSIYY
jgi:hypothetical protein